MSFLASAADDMPSPPIAEPSPTINDLHRQRDMLHAHNGNVMRLLMGCRARDASFNRPVIAYTVAGARNLLELALRDLDSIEAECLGIVAEQERTIVLTTVPRVPRYADAALPAVVSPAALS